MVYILLFGHTRNNTQRDRSRTTKLLYSIAVDDVAAVLTRRRIVPIGYVRNFPSTLIVRTDTQTDKGENVISFLKAKR